LPVKGESWTHKSICINSVCSILWEERQSLTLDMVIENCSETLFVGYSETSFFTVICCWFAALWGSKANPRRRWTEPWSWLHLWALC
jgi:hypothetical protein